MSRNPSLISHLRNSLAQELHSWMNLIRTDWHWLLLLCVGITALIILSRPLPPKDVYFAVGQEGSTFEMLGKKFIPYFEAEGVHLHLVNTQGSAKSLVDLAEKGNAVNAALMIGGVADSGAYPGLRSLGSVEYAPLWLFYRGPEFHGPKPFAYFSTKQVSVGPSGSAAEIILRRILALSGISIEGRPNVLKIPNKDAISRLLSNEIDGVFIMDGFNSPNIQELLQHPDIHVLNFSYAPAYVKKLPYMSVVTIPKGSLDLNKAYPAEDIQMLASTVTLLIGKDMHPAVQSIFLLAAEKISNELDQFFAKPEFFPAYVDHAVAISPIAKRFYEGGRMPMLERLPVWLSSYIDRMWLILLGLLAVIYPIFRLLPSYRSKHSLMIIEDGYDEIQEIDQLSANTNNPDLLRKLLIRLEQLDKDTRDGWVSSEEKNRLYTMKGALNLVRNQVLSKLEKNASSINEN